jgi:hypothetical protein
MPSRARRQQVLVVVRLPLDSPRAAQALRSAVGYLTVGLTVTVALCGPAAGSLAAATAGENPLPADVQRHLRTLQSLGQPVRSVDAAGLCQLLRDLAATPPAGGLPAACVVW